MILCLQVIMLSYWNYYRFVFQSMDSRYDDKEGSSNEHKH